MRTSLIKYRRITNKQTNTRTYAEKYSAKTEKAHVNSVEMCLNCENVHHIFELSSVCTMISIHIEDVLSVCVS